MNKPVRKFIPAEERDSIGPDPVAYEGAVPELKPITTRVLDVSDAEMFPNIAAALESYRAFRDGGR